MKPRMLTYEELRFMTARDSMEHLGATETEYYQMIRDSQTLKELYDKLQNWYYIRYTKLGKVLE